ncbi:unnamed protein product [Rotaria sp. Silwood2]|nr:unnamed protein product [Rotaria sp. Silwood2]CAF4569400.1 unnamed protein product [Rotaria sp. Silwood2]
MLQCALFYPYPNILHPTLFSKVRGNVLVLNNRIQCIEQDEFTYQEMFAFLPLLGHQNPKQVVIIDGGNSCTFRAFIKNPKS